MEKVAVLPEGEVWDGYQCRYHYGNYVTNNYVTSNIVTLATSWVSTFVTVNKAQENVSSCVEYCIHEILPACLYIVYTPSTHRLYQG